MHLSSSPRLVLIEIKEESYLRILPAQKKRGRTIYSTPSTLNLSEKFVNLFDLADFNELSTLNGNLYDQSSNVSIVIKVETATSAFVVDVLAVR